MITQVKIIPVRKRGNVTIAGSYIDSTTGKTVHLLADGKKVVTQLDAGDRIFQYTFESGIPLVLKLDTDDYGDQQVISFWKKHPLVQTAGLINPNLMNPTFEFEIHNDRVKVDYEAVVSKLKCVQVVSSMNPRERRDLAFALGSDPREMVDMEVFVHLIGLTLDGIAIARRDQVARFSEVRSIERQVTIYANKAIKYGLVTRDGAVYRVGGRNLGGSVDSVIATLLADNELYENYIRPEVDRVDKDELAQAQEINDPILAGLPEGLAELIPAVSSNEKKAAGRGKNAGA